MATNKSWFDEILPPEERKEIESWVTECCEILNIMTCLAIALPDFIDARFGDDPQR